MTYTYATLITHSFHVLEFVPEPVATEAISAILDREVVVRAPLPVFRCTESVAL
jgi:hypothetical protein